ncbi:Oxidoreductase OS=Streptomyces microflavus OX=1919 GN=Smic_48370 PE=4 SV=1 [Streptomyces microflavus]
MTSQVSSAAEKADEANDAVLGASAPPCQEPREPRRQREGGPPPGPGDHSLRGRLGRRYAAHGRPVHLGDGIVRERSLRPCRTSLAGIRAPAGTLPGVSSFQLHFADHDVLTPGDAPDDLVAAMNPAALKANIDDVPRGAEIVVNADGVTERPMAKVGICDQSARGRVTGGVQRATSAANDADFRGTEGEQAIRKEAERSNMFALGLLSWMYHRPNEGTRRSCCRSSRRSRRSPRRTWPRSGPGGISARRPRTWPSRYEVAPTSQRSPRHLPQHLREPRPDYGLIAAGRLADLRTPGLLPDAPRPPTSSRLLRHKNVERRPSTTRLMSDQVDAAVERDGKGDLGALLAGADTWTVVG